MSNPTYSMTFSPGVMSLLPMIYVGWSDSVLSPSEMKVIDNRIQALHFLSSADKEYLCSIIDPAKPPLAKDFRIWLKEIRKSAEGLSLDEKMSLMDLGIAIAKSGVGGDDIRLWESNATRNALTEIGKALGVDSYLSSILLIPRLQKEQKSIIADSTTDLIDKLRSLMDGPHVDLKERMRLLLRDPFFAPNYEPDKDIHRIKVLDQLKKLADQGLSAFAFPEKYGGKSDPASAMTVFEMLSYADLSCTVKFGVQFGLFGGALYQLGTEKHHRQYLEATIRGELLGCFAMTETGHGSNVKDLGTTATYDQKHHEIIIHSPSFAAGKEYIGNALDCHMAVVFAQLIVGENNHGIHAVLVPIRDKKKQLKQGIKVEDSGYKMGLNGVDNGRIWFNNVSVPADNLLNRFGEISLEGEYLSSIANPSKRFFTMLGTLVMGRISVGLASVSAAKKSLVIAGKYALRRRQFAPSNQMQESLIIDYPTHQDRLFPLLAATYAYDFATHDLAAEYAVADRDDLRQIETIAAGLKSKASWLCTKAIQECREACGGKGYLQENQIPAIKADADIFTTFEGDNTVLMQLVSKGLLTEFKQSFHDEGFRAVIRFLVTRARHSIDELNPLYKRNTDFDHITSPEFLHHALTYRYKKMLISLSQRMRKFLRQGIEPYQAFLKTQVHMVDLAHAFIDDWVFNAFVNRVEAVEDPESREILGLLLKIYGMTLLHQHRGWYLENDYMEGSKTRAIRRARTKLYQSLRPNFDNLLEAFGIPKELIAAPIVVS